MACAAARGSTPVQLKCEWRMMGNGVTMVSTPCMLQPLRATETTMRAMPLLQAAACRGVHLLPHACISSEQTRSRLQQPSNPRSCTPACLDLAYAPAQASLLPGCLPAAFLLQSRTLQPASSRRQGAVQIAPRAEVANS